MLQLHGGFRVRVKVSVRVLFRQTLDEWMGPKVHFSDWGTRVYGVCSISIFFITFLPSWSVSPMTGGSPMPHPPCHSVREENRYYQVCNVLPNYNIIATNKKEKSKAQEIELKLNSFNHEYK